MKQIFFSILIGSLFCCTAFSQENWTSLDIPTIAMESVNNKDLQEYYQSGSKDSQAPQFAHPFKVGITSSDFIGINVDEHTNYYLKISSPGAKSLNLGFEHFQLPENGAFYIYSYQDKEWLGPFVKETKEVMEYWTPIIAGDEICLKAVVPANTHGEFDVRITSVNHDFMGFGAVSGSCNLDVVCGSADGFDEVDLYRDIIRSVGVYTFNGVWFCSGALINTADRSCKPYFLTANHCINGNANGNGVVIYWNFENSFCRQPGSTESGRDGDGQLDQFNSGTEVLASNATSDFTLLEVSGDIDEDVNAFLAGWNKERKAPPAAIAIHHPDTDEKRISFEFDPLEVSDYLSTTININEHFLWVDDWDIGTTEPGSSGSPLFDEDKRIIGQLSGGFAACGNQDSDWYGFMASNFSEGTNASNGVSNYLDPQQTDVITVDGEEYNTCGQSNALILALMDTVCNDTDTLKYEIVNNDLNNDLSISIETGSNNPTSSFSNGNTVSPGASTILFLTDLSDYSTGVNNFDITIDQNGSSSSRTLSFVRRSIPDLPQVVSPVDGSELLIPFTLEWENTGDNYTVRYSLNADLSDATEVNTNTPSLLVDNLDLGNQYFFEIIAHNVCGSSPAVLVSYLIRDLTCTQLTADEDVMISDNATVSVPFNVDISNGLAYLEIRNLDIEHTFVGDLVIELGANGQSIVLLDEECGSSNNVLLGFKDDGLNTIPCPPTTGLDYQPETPFSAWYGRTDIDQFSLDVSDLADGDDGLIREVSIFYCTEKLSGGYITDDFADEMYQYDTLSIALEIDTNVFGANNVNLTANLPAGISFNNFSGTFDQNLAEFELISANAMTGTYAIDFVAESSLARDTVRLDLTVLPCYNHPMIDPIPDTVRTYYQIFNWNEVGSSGYRFNISDNRDAANGNIYDSGTTSNTEHLSVTLPTNQFLYFTLESVDQCVVGDASVDSFYVEYNYDISYPTDTLVICPGDTMSLDLVIGNRFFDSLRLDIIGDDMNEFSFDFNESDLFNGNEVSVRFTPGNSQEGLVYSFLFVISDFVAFVDDVEIYIRVDWDNVDLQPTSPANDAEMIMSPFTLEWDGPPVSATLELSRASDFSVIDYSYDVTGMNAFTFTEDLEELTKYYWRLLSESSCNSAISSSFTFVSDMTESINEPEELQDFTVFPNPTFDDLNYVHSESGNINFSIYDVHGRKLSEQIDEYSIDNIGKINTSNLSPGMYILEVQIGEKVLHRKINKL